MLFHAFAALIPRSNGSIAKSLLGIGHDQLWIKRQNPPQSQADFASAQRRVKRKMARRQPFVDFAGDRAVQFVGMARLPPRRFLCVLRFPVKNDENSASPLQRHLRGIRKAGANFFINHQAIDDRFNLRFAFGGKRKPHVLRQFHQFPVNPGADKTFASKTLERAVKILFLLGLCGCQQHHAAAAGQSENFVNNIRSRSLRNRTARIRAMRLTGVSKEKPQKVKQLRRCGDGRPGIDCRRPLFDGDGRRKPFNEVHVRLLQLIEKLASVGGKRFHIFAPPLSKNCVKNQRRFPRTAQPGKNHQLVPRDARRNVLQIVFPSTANPNAILTHKRPISFRVETPSTMRPASKKEKTRKAPRINKL